MISTACLVIFCDLDRYLRAFFLLSGPNVRSTRELHEPSTVFDLGVFSSSFALFLRMSSSRFPRFYAARIRPSCPFMRIEEIECRICCFGARDSSVQAINCDDKRGMPRFLAYLNQVFKVSWRFAHFSPFFFFSFLEQSSASRDGLLTGRAPSFCTNKLVGGRSSSFPSSSSPVRAFHQFIYFSASVKLMNSGRRETMKRPRLHSRRRRNATRWSRSILSSSGTQIPHRLCSAFPAVE